VTCGVDHGAPRCDVRLQSRARLMASSATRWVRWWRTKVKAHVLGLWGSPSARGNRACKRRKASSVTRHGRHRSSPALHVTRKTRSDVSLSHRCTMEHHDCTMEHHDATGVSPETNGVKASPHRHKWMLSPGAPADPSDPWNSHAAPVSPRQNGCPRLSNGPDPKRNRQSLDNFYF
jgi:hypothetical protein